MASRNPGAIHFRANPDAYTGTGAEFVVEQFAFHPFQQLGGLQQAVRVFGDATRLQAILDDMNESMFSPVAENDATTSAMPIGPTIQ